MKVIPKLIVLIGLVVVALPAVFAGQEEAPRLQAREAGDFLGDWVLTVKSDQGEQALDFSVSDVEGFAQAEIEMPGMPKKLVDHIEKTDPGLLRIRWGQMQWTAAFSPAS